MVPEHYKTSNDFDVIDVAKSYGLNFNRGNVIKYVCRYKNKAGIQDLEKIIHYCELEIKTMKDMGKKK